MTPLEKEAREQAKAVLRLQRDLKAARKRRDRSIAKLARKGYSETHIGRIVHLSRGRVHIIISGPRK